MATQRKPLPDPLSGEDLDHRLTKGWNIFMKSEEDDHGESNSTPDFLLLDTSGEVSTSTKVPVFDLSQGVSLSDVKVKKRVNRPFSIIHSEFSTEHDMKKIVEELLRLCGKRGYITKK